MRRVALILRRPTSSTTRLLTTPSKNSTSWTQDPTLDLRRFLPTLLRFQQRSSPRYGIPSNTELISSASNSWKQLTEVLTMWTTPSWWRNCETAKTTRYAATWWSFQTLSTATRPLLIQSTGSAELLSPWEWNWTTKHLKSKSTHRSPYLLAD